MASRAELTRNNVRAGVFVTGCLFLMMAVIVILSDVVSAVTQSFETYTVVYSVQQGVGDIKPGSDVRVGGVALGRVSEVIPRHVEGEPLEAISVEFKLDSRVTLHEDARVLIKSPLIGADSWLYIPDVGQGQPLPGGAELMGSQTAGLLPTLLGGENAEKTTTIMDNAKDFSSFLADIPGDYDSKVVPMLDGAQLTVADIQAVAAVIRKEDWPAWSGSIDQVMTWAEGATTSFDETLAEGRNLFADGRDVVADNREDIRSIIENVDASSVDVRAITERARTETMDKIDAVVQRGQDALDEAVAAISTLRQDYEGWATSFDEVMANATLTAQQLKLASAEVRRSPWKLLYRPTADELEHEMLYESARSFAMAATNLKASAESVDRILEKHSDRIADDPATFERMKQNLEESLDQYQRAQDQLFDVLVTK